jgi:CheY-like chemotaxis protein
LEGRKERVAVEVAEEYGADRGDADRTAELLSRREEPGGSSAALEAVADQFTATDRDEAFDLLVDLFVSGLAARRHPVAAGQPPAKSVVNRTSKRPAACHDSSVTTVLIVDDHPTFRRTARALLEEEGFDVVGEAADGASAIDATASLRPDVVLLDVYLPDIDGFDVVAQLARNGHPPAIVLTSSHDARDFGRLVEGSGVRGFIPKAELSGAALAALLG